jgi:hypothetical protein
MTLQELADVLHVIEPGSLSEAMLGVCIVWWLMKDIAVETANSSRLNKRLEEVEERIRLLQARSSRRMGHATVPRVHRRTYKTRYKKALR